MAKRVINPEEIKACFELYLLHNGERHDLIEKEMHRLGWTAFRKAILKSKGFGPNRRDGWIDQYGWQKSLELKIATANTAATTSAESLLFEVEAIRKKIFVEVDAGGVGRAGKDLIYQHDKYVQRSIDILAQLDRARDNYANFVFFLQKLVAAAPKISPQLAKEICDAEEGLIEWAEAEFTTEEAAAE